MKRSPAHSAVPAGRTLFSFAAVAFALWLAACGDEDEQTGTTNGAAVVATSTGVMSELVREVAGDQVEIVQMVPIGADPHSYAPSAQEQAGLEDAELLVYTADSLEANLPISAAARSFAVADHTGGGAAGEDGKGHSDENGHSHEGGHDDAHSNDEADPHVWLDPTQLEGALPELVESLSEVDGIDAAALKAEADRFATELRELDEQLAAALAEIPEENRVLITSHESMAYFADRYDLEYPGAVLPAAPEAGATAADVRDVIGEIEEAGVPAVFAQQGDDSQVLTQIADETNVEIVDELRLSAPEEGQSYSEMMQAAAERISEALQ